MRRFVAAVLAIASGFALAQSGGGLLDSYIRVMTITNDTSVYVVEMLGGCVKADILPRSQGDTRFNLYLSRNSAVLKRAEEWRKNAEKQLRAGPEEQAFNERAFATTMASVKGAMERARSELKKAADIRALCKDRIAAIDAGEFDFERSAELLGIIGKGN